VIDEQIDFGAVRLHVPGEHVRRRRFEHQMIQCRLRPRLGARLAYYAAHCFVFALALAGGRGSFTLRDAFEGRTAKACLVECAALTVANMLVSSRTSSSSCGFARLTPVI
jgi:hypothetical protein